MRRPSDEAARPPRRSSATKSPNGQQHNSTPSRNGAGGSLPILLHVYGAGLKRKGLATLQALDLFGCGGAQLVPATPYKQGLTTQIRVQLGNRVRRRSYFQSPSDGGQERSKK
jgi:hypothetical protein